VEEVMTAKKAELVLYPEEEEKVEGSKEFLRAKRDKKGRRGDRKSFLLPVSV
jgi:hypothetical protein